MSKMREVREEERKIYYKEEWSPNQVPEFIKDSIDEREFGFDHDGTGPSDRYNSYFTLKDLKEELKLSYPYSVYTSISFYEEPMRRKNWQGAELTFDIDAKDLPVRSCDCEIGEVCPVCLEDAKQLSLKIIDALKDLGLRDIYFVYSGRGYHIRVFDDWILSADSKGREKVLEYVSGSKIPRKDTDRGYSRVFKNFALHVLKRVNKSKLRNIEGLGDKSIKKLKKKADEDRKNLNIGNRKGEKNLYEWLSKVNSDSVDAKVTMDVKRILRMPSSLHSKAGMICKVIPRENWENFNPFEDAVPKFREDEIKNSS